LGQSKRINAPLYWRKIDGEWFQFTLGGLRKLNPKNPVCHVSFYEAAAFAEWKRLRLPTEFEWEAASRQFDWGLRWEWTNSAYLPYPHFRRAGRRNRRIQRQIYDQPDGSARRKRRHVARSQPPDLPQLFSSAAALAIYGNSFGEVTSNRAT
jgi:formylglycine-generating enzyme required for sulfatase activity